MKILSYRRVQLTKKIALKNMTRDLVILVVLSTEVIAMLLTCKPKDEDIQY